MKNDLYTEDTFDLEESKKQIKKRKEQQERIIHTKKEIAVYTVLSAALFITILTLVYRISVYYIELRQNRLIAERAREIASLPTPVPEPSPSAKPSAAPKPSATPPPPAEVSEAPVERSVLEVILNLREEFDNEDIIGYLKIEDTNIDYPVVQGEDNIYYLSRDLNLKKNAAGTVFMDYENDTDTIGRNTVLYGHNMRNGSMFHNLRYYRDKQFYEDHRYVKFSTLYEETVWEIFAVYDTTIAFNYIQVRFRDDEDFMSLISQMYEKSLYKTGIEIGPEDKVLTLSTCTSTNDVARFVVSARLIEEETGG